ncbi:MAG: hypothetical protein LBK72_04795 [Bifidobacteriaceae bacterium]|nr:hypothetical protein [Bifidobacteriaceae bacterium]
MPPGLAALLATTSRAGANHVIVANVRHTASVIKASPAGALCPAAPR